MKQTAFSLGEVGEEKRYILYYPFHPHSTMDKSLLHFWIDFEGKFLYIDHQFPQENGVSCAFTLKKG